MNKKGFATINLLVMVFFGLMLLIIMGIMVFTFSLVDDQMNTINFTIGNTSFNEAYTQTLGQGINSMKIQVPQTISLGVLFGMIIVLLLIGYFMINLDPLWIILDIAVIIGAEIAAVAVSGAFRDFIDSSPEFLDIYSTTLQAPATFILNLPAIIPVVGVLIMGTTYIFSKRNADRKGGARF